MGAQEFCDRDIVLLQELSNLAVIKQKIIESGLQELCDTDIILLQEVGCRGAQEFDYMHLEVSSDSNVILLSVKEPIYNIVIEEFGHRDIISLLI